MQAFAVKIAATVVVTTAVYGTTFANSAEFGLRKSVAPQHLRLAARSDGAKVKPASSRAIKAIRLASDGRHDKARALKAQIKDQAALKLIDWLYIRSSKSRAGFNTIAKFITANPDWPQIERLRAHAETQLYTNPQTPDRVLAISRAIQPRPGLACLLMPVPFSAPANPSARVNSCATPGAGITSARTPSARS